MRTHSRFRRFVSLLLAVLVLTASVGLTVQRLTCRMSGRSTVTVAVAGAAGADPAGCPGASAPTTLAAEGTCCDFSKQLHKLSVPAAELAAKTLPPAPLLVALAATALHWPAAPTAFAADTSPPPRGGRTLLAFACTLVV